MIIVGPSTFSLGGTLHFGYYNRDPNDGSTLRLAMWVDQGDGSRAYVATVNLDAPPPVGSVWLKSWGGNEGVPEALAKAGVVVLRDEHALTGRCLAQRADLTTAAIAELVKQKPARPSP